MPDELWHWRMIVMRLHAMLTDWSGGKATARLV
jgi:hypothetical protein